MQEDKSFKWLAAKLRKQQEENPLPYELGAWEAFEKRRAALSPKRTRYWVSGVAASLILLLVAGGLWLGQFSDSDDAQLSDQLVLQEKLQSADATGNERLPNPDAILAEPNEATVSGAKEKVLAENQFSISSSKNNTPKGSNSANTKSSVLGTESTVNSSSGSKSNPPAQQPNQSQALIDQSKTVEKEVLIAVNEKAENETLKNAQTQVPASPVAELPKEPLLAKEEIAEILETKSTRRLALGLSPGYGASQSKTQATSGSSLGLGVMVDMDIAGKLMMGSGLAVNYLNQASESQSYAQVAGFSSPVTERNEIAQVQVDIPLYFKYPVTSNQSISVQAGFSNLITFSQGAEQQSSFTRQVAVFDASSASANSFTLKSESINQSSVLDVPQNRFYPLATANLGVNIRLFESKKTSYAVMPFYNYPLQEISGYGEKLGIFGASFKVTFTSTDKK
ncbi:hypothetical protein [Algoriphagus sp.]|uniref:hypothetical protein n=1 Tax=Algoriphagus sp. TaxID=1872435 RepID=UPI00271B48A0|nr:hypothetical protein [Algoriphagus sp.]MDO8965254.1 hypothetical protein [Algoriphagus sp.]MDP3198968.1 hypothetical protein [Algoriphagus sp.]